MRVRAHTPCLLPSSCTHSAGVSPSLSTHTHTHSRMLRESLVILLSCLVNAVFLLTHTALAGHPDLVALTSCLSHAGVSNVTSRSSPSAYSTLLDFSLQNLRFAEVGVPTPDLLILPQSAPQVQNALLCSVQAAYQVRVRCGGHSYEGLSSYGTSPFVIIDLMNMNSVSIDLASKTAWVEGGATLGEIYYAIAQVSPLYGFAAGVCPTVGSSGHISGGGYGFLSRKYGTAADNVIDAHIVDAQGLLLDRATMGEDVFWAIRGGGGGTFGVVVAWKLQLVSVTPIVTTFNLRKTGKEALSELIYRWQAIAPSAPPELFHAVYMAGFTSNNKSDVEASFYGQYLGTLSETLALMTEIYPELNLAATDCKEGKWIEGVANIAGITNIEELLSKQNKDKGYFKAKSDYVREAIPKQGIMGALSKLEANPGKGYMIFEPYGGVMNNIEMDAIAFPYRAGILYNIQYQALWIGDAQGTMDASLMEWIRDLYAYMGCFVSHSPRAAYVNYIDLDLGIASSVAQAEASWGRSYFLSNFPRLAHIKACFDPSNVFSHPQSIPPSLSNTLLHNTCPSLQNIGTL